MKLPRQSFLIALVTCLSILSLPIPGLAVAVAVVKQDFDGDGKSDILWRNSANGQNSVWLMNGSSLGTGALITPVADPSWVQVGIGDFNGDGKADILWRNATTGDNSIWLMNGSNVLSSSFIPSLSDLSWTVAGIGDFNGDGKADILWRNTSTGENAIWLMNGFSLSSSGFLATLPDPNWSIVGVGDFNGDTPNSKSDILWRNSATGQNAIWFVDGTTVTSSAFLSTVSPAWTISGTGDYNNDGKADILWRNTSTGENAIWMMNSSAILSSGFITPVADQNWAIIGTGDYNADGNADILWRNSLTGDNAVWLMSGLSIASSATTTAVPDFNWTPLSPSPLAQVAGQIKNFFTQFASVVNSKGSTLTSTDLAPFYDASYLGDGLNASLAADSLASNARGATLNSVAITRVVSFDPVNRTAAVQLLLSITESGVTRSQTLQSDDDVSCFKQQSDGSWKIYGNQRIARIHVTIGMLTTNYSGSAIGPMQNVGILVWPPQGTLSAASFTGGGQANFPIPKAGPEIVTLHPTPTTTTTYVRDNFYNNFNPSSQIESGSAFTVNVTRASDGVQFGYSSHFFGVAVTDTVNGAVTITSAPGGHSLTSLMAATNNLANPVSFTWTLPTAYAIQGMEVGGSVRTADGTSCSVDNVQLAANLTSGQITLPSPCAGQPISQASVFVGVFGTHGEQSQYVYGWQ